MLTLRSFRLMIRAVLKNTWVQPITFQTAPESIYSSGQRIRITFQAFYLAIYLHKQILKQLTFKVRLDWLPRVKRCYISIIRIGKKHCFFNRWDFIWVCCLFYLLSPKVGLYDLLLQASQTQSDFQKCQSLERAKLNVFLGEFLLWMVLIPKEHQYHWQERIYFLVTY